MEPCPPVLSKPSSAPALLFPSPSCRFPPQGGAGDLSKPTGADFPQDKEGRHEVAGRLENSQGNYLVFPFPIELA